MGGGYRYYLMGLFWFRMDYRCTLLLAVGNQRESFITDVSRPLKQSGLDSSFDSGLTVVSLKKKKEKKNGPSVTNDPSGAAPTGGFVLFPPLYRRL